MKNKLTYLLFLLTFSTLIGMGNVAIAALTVSATGTNGTCSNDAKITATAAGNTGAVSYQLLQGTTVIRAYQTSNVFPNLPAGTYSVVAQDIATSNTATSGNVTLTTNYATMEISIPTTQVGCATATNGTLTVTATKGKAPYTYSISPDPNGVGVQSTTVFSNLPVGSYTFSITDACGTTVTQSSSVSSTSTKVADIQPPFGGAYFAWGNFQNGEYNDCSKGAFVNTYAWSYKSTNATITSFDKNHFYWRYEYPSGSGNLYGAGGVLNGAMVSLNTQSIPAPATAVYPFADGDIIIYDECGNSYRNVKNLWQSTTTSSPLQGTGNRANPIYDCVQGGGVTMQFTPYQTICAPVTYTFIDNATSAVITQVLPISGASVTTYGLVPGHTYTVKALDALGHNATTTTSLTIPIAVGAMSLYSAQKSPQYANAANVTINYPVVIPANTTVNYTVVASNNSAIPIGYARSFTYPSAINTNANLYGHPTFGTGTVWPAGTYTLEFNSAACLDNKILTFTVPVGYQGSFNGTKTITPTCGAFNASFQATLDNPLGYQMTIISGPSNVGALRGFNATAVSAGTYNSLSFDGLNYGTYTFGLLISGGSTPIATQTVTYTATNALTIDALSTGGYACSGSTTGSLVVAASSASGSALQYSNDSGLTWQASNIFAGAAIGSYPVKVKDACGNIVSYTATVVAASGIFASASSTTPCEKSNIQLSVNAIGATSYAWTGPNGFTSNVQNPALTNLTLAGSGTYTVTVTSPSCTNVASVVVTVNPLPVASIAYSGGSLCATGTAVPTITGTTGGTFSSAPGLILTPSTGVIDLATSVAGTYTVTYTFSNGTCTSTAATTVTVKAVPLLVTNAQSTCAPGKIDLTATAVTTGSTAGLTYAYYSDAAGTTPLASPNNVTASGTYYIQGYLASTGCYSKVSAVTVNIQPQPTVVITDPASVCAPSKVDLTASSVTAGSGANLALAYYTNSAGTAVLSSPNAVATSGTYYIQGTNTITGCTSAVMPVKVTVSALPNAPVVSITAQPICGTPTGSISITGVTGETYSVDGSAYTSTLTYSGLTPGSHTVLAKNAGICISTATNITINSALATANAPVVAVAAQPNCGTPTGSIVITGVTGETYSVDGGTYSATLTYSGLAPGAHAVLAKSAGGCISVATNITINSAPTGPTAPAVTATQPSCGTPTGSISITGVTGETYSVDGGTYSATLTYSGLAPGAHAVLAKSAGGCISAATNITINSAPTGPTAPAVTATQPSCGTSTGSILITAVTGETYSVDGGTYLATLTYSGLTPGTHAVLAKSAGGCISVATNITINPAPTGPTAPTVTATQPGCGTPTGSIVITGVTGETYSVDGRTYSATLTYSGLAPGAHAVLAKSAGGCISAATNITINSAPTGPTAPAVTATQPNCGTPTGSIAITAVTGETYSVDGSAYTSTLTYSGLTPGAHAVLTKSSGGCISVATNVTINPAPTGPTAPAVTATQPSCGMPTGSISITGVTGETYSVDGSAYTSTLTYSGLTPGTHIVKAKSADGCLSTGTDAVISPAKATASAPVVSVTAQPTCSVATGSISITGATGESYSVDGGAYSATLTYSGLTPGSHTITAKSADGCISNTANITINAQPATPVATIAYGSAQYQTTGTASVVQTGQTGGSYAASPSGLGINGTTGTIDLGASTPDQTYTVTYTFGNGSCTGTATAMVRINSAPATIAYAKPAYCAVGTADIIRTGPANGAYTSSSAGLKISGTSGAINLGASTPGSYTVSYTYRDGTVTAVATTSVSVTAMPVVSVSSDRGTDISRGDIVVLTATGGTSYSWSGADIQSGQNTAVLKARPRQTTTYTVTAVNAGGCSDVSQITITVTDDFRLEPNNVVTPNGDGKNDTWVIRNLDYYPNNTVGIYDRAGRKVYGASSYKNDWDGSYNGQPLAEGAYIYVIDLGKGIGLIRGTISIIRDNR